MISCPLCASKNARNLCVIQDIELFTTDEQYEYYECGDCDAIFIHPMPISQLSQIYPENYYGNHANTEVSLIEKVKERIDRKVFLDVTKQIPESKLSVLDVGGGNGWLLNMLKKCEPRVNHTAVVDINSAAESLARANGHKFYCSRIEEFKPDQKFDLIIMLNLIEHVSEPGKVLKNVASMLTPNGRVIIKTPNTDTLDRKLFIKSYWGGLHCPRHWVLFNEANFTKLVQSSNLEICQFTYTQGAPQWTTSILGTLYMKGYITGSVQRPIEQHWLCKPLLILTAAFDLARAPFSKTAQFFAVLELAQ